MVSKQTCEVLGYQLTLFGPRGADYARHITTGPPIFLHDGASLLGIQTYGRFLISNSNRSFKLLT